MQAANGTETDDDREAVQNEIVQLQDELTRISETTEFNTMKLLDGSLGGSSSTTGSGPKFCVVDATLKLRLQQRQIQKLARKPQSGMLQAKH